MNPSVPAGSFAPGTRVEVLWPPDAIDQKWWAGLVTAVQSDGCYVVRYEQSGTWGDTERGIKPERLRAVDN